MSLHQWFKNKSYATSVLDIPVKTSDDARAIELLVKQAEEAGGGYHRITCGQSSFDIQEKADKKPDDTLHRRSAVITASSDAVDRDAEIVNQKGIDLKLYKRNPLVMWNHSYDQYPLGHSLWQKVVGTAGGQELKALIAFANRPKDYPPEIDWAPATVWDLLVQKVYRSFSIGFLALDVSPPTDKEIKGNPLWATARSIIRKSVLLEISVVGVPSNAYTGVDQLFEVIDTEQDDEKSCFTWDTADCLEPIQVKAIAPPVFDRVKAMREIRRQLA